MSLKSDTAAALVEKLQYWINSPIMTTPMFKSSVLTVLLALLAGAASAETRYITDQLEVTMRSGQSTRNAIVRMLRSGAAVEVLETDAEAGYTKVRVSGGTPYIIPGGASNPVGALGYVGCAEELLQQCEAQDVAFDHVVLASGSAGTHAGMAVGLRASGSDLPILGIGVNVPRDEQEAKVWDLACATADYIDRPGCVSRQDIVADCSYVGAGYGEPTEGMNEAVLMLARTEGLLFDPVYSGKALAGMIDYIRAGRFTPGQKIVFLHTGGVAGLFAYADILAID